MVSFFTSFAILWFKGEDNVVISVVAISCFVFAVIVAWGAAAAYETGQYESYAGKVVKKTGAVGEKVKNSTVEAVKSAKRRMSTVVYPLTRGGGRPGDAIVNVQPPQGEKRMAEPPESIPGICGWWKRYLFGRKRVNLDTPQV